MPEPKLEYFIDLPLPRGPKYWFIQIIFIAVYIGIFYEDIII